MDYSELENTLENTISSALAYVVEGIAARAQARIDARKKKRSIWVKPWLQRRHQLGAYDGLMVELANEDLEGYISFQRMAPDLFAELLSKVGPIIQKQDTVMRSSISPGARLALTLRFLATGRNTLFF